MASDQNQIIYKTVTCRRGHSQYKGVYAGYNTITCPQCASMNAREAAALRSWNSTHPTYFTHIEPYKEKSDGVV